MDYEDMIEEEQKPAEETTAVEAEPVPEEPRTKSPWKAFILTGFIAALIGAAGGGYGAYAGLQHLSPAPEAQPQVDLSPIETRLKQLANRVSAAESTARKAANRPVAKAEPVDMSAIEARLNALETAPSPEIDPEALKSLQAAKNDGFEWPDTSDLESRLAGLEALASETSQAELPTDLTDRLTALEAKVETVQNSEPAAVVDDETLSKLNARLTALESRSASTAPAIDAKKLTALTARLKALENRPPPAPTVERVSILAFPKTRMLEAAENNVEGGLFKKTISRHIRVKSANDPLTLIAGIETDISEGRLAAAAKKFERLPTPVRDAGQAWYESVKASL